MGWRQKSTRIYDMDPILEEGHFFMHIYHVFWGSKHNKQRIYGISFRETCEWKLVRTETRKLNAELLEPTHYGSVGVEGKKWG